jgi:2-polyprenyl-6-methoxyphenol hydroxylase-like FAD-dependent oxidoreductase
MTRRSAPIRVAVIGGGLGFDGPLIAGVLARNPILDVQLYDPADDVYGSGGIIELSFRAVKALGGVIPNVDEILKTKVGAVPMDEAHIVKVRVQ